MEFEIIGWSGEDSPDPPRDLTDVERSQLRTLSRLAAIKQHRAWTRSTLGAAIRIVDAIQKAV